MARKVPERCKGCAKIWLKGQKGTPYERWCCGHGLPLHKADPHCRSGKGNDKFAPAQGPHQ